VKIAVDICIGKRGIDALVTAGHDVVWWAGHGERDEVWFAQAMRRGSELFISTDRDIEILCWDRGVEFFRVDQFERDTEAIARFVRGSVCRACAFHLQTHGVKCLAHTPKSLRSARARAIGSTR
jgi:hypothetical protein